MNWNFLRLVAILFCASVASSGVSYTDVLAGIVFGLLVSVLWIAGSAIQFKEYWDSNVPKWINWFSGEPSKQKLPGIPLKHNHYLFKTLSLLFAIGGMAGHLSTLYITFFAIFWVIPICIAEVYFRRNYKRVTDWSVFEKA